MINIEDHSSDFFILDDGTDIINLDPLLFFFKNYFESVNVLYIDNIAKKMYYELLKLIDIQDVVFVGIGQGGAAVVDCILKESKYQAKTKNITFRRQWTNKQDFEFIKDEIDVLFYYNKKIILVEDVIASGQTINEVVNFFKITGAKIIGIMVAIISENCGMIYQNTEDIFICGTVIHALSYSSTNFDPYWYPPVYSLRHLLYGEEEQPFFYDQLYEKYNISKDKIIKIVEEIKPKISSER